MRWISIVIFVLWSGMALAQTSAASPAIVADKTLKDECDAGQVISCEMLAKRYIEILNQDSELTLSAIFEKPAEKGSERSPKMSITDWDALFMKIFAVAKRGCDLKSADSCFYLSVAYGSLDFGTTTKMTAVEVQNLRVQNRQRSDALVSLSCDYGSIVSCKTVADSYRYTEPPALKKAAGLYAKTCDAGLLKSCEELIELFNFQGIERGSKPIRFSATEAFEVKLSIEQDCAATSRFTCLVAAGGYLFGKPPFEPDISKGLGLLNAGCEAGNRYACLIQGALLTEFIPANEPRDDAFPEDELPRLAFLDAIPKDPAKGKALIQKACATVFPATANELEKICLELNTKHGL